MLDVSTSRSECPELIQSSPDLLLIFISDRLDVDSGVGLINAIADHVLAASADNHITVLTLKTANTLSLTGALDSAANIILTERGFETFTIHQVLHSEKSSSNEGLFPYQRGALEMV